MADKTVSLDKYRNIGIIAHIDAGSSEEHTSELHHRCLSRMPSSA